MGRGQESVYGRWRSRIPARGSILPMDNELGASVATSLLGEGDSDPDRHRLRLQGLCGHPLVSTLATEKKLPSYIGSGTFASALVDLLTPEGAAG